MNPPPPGSVRIIAGHWRGSKLPVPASPGLRPTSDRVRETVFNWLQPMLPGAQVLDLFAGSGALGFEAASRGAARVVLVERDAALARNLCASAERLKASQVQVRQADALAWLQGPPEGGFHLVFLDPPFDAGLWEPAAAAVLPWLAPGALVYVERPPGPGPALPAGWQLHREGQTRDVHYALFRAGGGPGPESAATLRGDPHPQGNSSA